LKDAAAKVEPTTVVQRGDVDLSQTSYAWARLVDQLDWYERKSGENKAWFLRLKVLQIVLAAAVPVAAGGDASAWVTGSLGASIVVLEGIQQLFQFQQNWASYRTTAESLKHEKYLFLSRAVPFSDVADPDALLAERVEGLVSQEHAAWSSAQASSGSAAKP
jgi:hypothetical protein